jgi:hypothetical protein
MAFDRLHAPAQGGVGANKLRIGLWIECEFVVSVEPIERILPIGFQLDTCSLSAQFFSKKYKKFGKILLLKRFLDRINNINDHRRKTD